MKHFKFVQNTACEYFPCHKDVPEEEFNCLFCYCPLYALKDSCEGDFTYLENGIKSCMGCKKPHDIEGYEHIQTNVRKLIDLTRKESL